MKFRLNFKLFSTLLLGAVFASSTVQAKALPDFVDLVEKNSPAVVNISTTQKLKVPGHKGYGAPNLQLPENSPFNELFRHFFDEDTGSPRQREAQSLGSGFIISKDGYIMTNHHVIDGADQVIVRLNNRKTYEAQIIGSDRASDIALIKVDAQDLPTVKIGKSSELKIGEWVLAIGSPFGFESTVTAGIVSAKHRALPSENYVPYIQTDVAINPGNSGGPLFDLDGEVVGINSQIFSRSGGFMGLSFAVPIELAMNVVDQLRTSGQVSRGYLGVLIQDVDRNLAETFGMNRPKGALVAKILPGSPAEKSGIQLGDVILKFNDQELRESSQLPPMVGNTKAGNRARLTVLRQGKEQQVDITIGELPTEDGRALVQSDRRPETSSDRLGLNVSDMSEIEREKLGLPGDAGVLVGSVSSGAAKLAGIAEGDVILMLDGRKVTSAAEFRKTIDAIQSGKTTAMLIHKPNGPVFIALRVPE
jgi:serine protease Do